MKIIEWLYRHVYIAIYRYIFMLRTGSVAKNVHINGPITVINPGRLSIGNDCSLNHGVYINCFNPVTIGNDVTISANATIVSTGLDYESWFSSGNRRHTKNDGLIIADHVWLGCGANVLKSITGNYVVVASNATVCTEIKESYCVVAGTPAKVIKRYARDDSACNHPKLINVQFDPNHPDTFAEKVVD